MYTVFVEDHVTHEKVVIGDLLTRSEASELTRILDKYCACTIYTVECEFYYKKGKHEK